MKNKTKVIIDAICGSLIMLSILLYIILGLAVKWWHPGWVIIVGTIIVVSIISIITNAVVEVNKTPQDKTPEEKK